MNAAAESDVREVSADQKLDDKGKRQLIQAFKEYSCLGNTSQASYKQ